MMRIVIAASVVAALACRDTPATQGASVSILPRAPERPDEAPVLVNKVLPFRYPAALYARKVQGNVTLRLYVDRDGRVVPESTQVDESSGVSSMDSAAVVGSRDLHFVPAKLHGEPMAVAVLFPVYFRHPEAAPLPGDTILTVRQP
jgi:TonB family protein